MSQEEGPHRRSKVLLCEELYFGLFREETNYFEIFERNLICACHSQDKGQKVKYKL